MRVRRGTETVLVVDDDPGIVRLVQGILTPLGYKVLDAVSGQDALQLAEEAGDDIDLLLTDVVMPEMQGVELADIFCEKYPAAKILYMSGYMSPPISNDEKYAGRKGFMQKPLSSRELANTVRKMLD